MQFIEAAAGAETPDAVIAALGKHLARCDVLCFSHRSFLSSDVTVDHSTFPKEWVDHYYSVEYFRDDPGARRVGRTDKPVHMHFAPTHNSYHAEGRAQEMFGEMTSFHAWGSLFVPFKESDDLPAASVNFITDCKMKHFDLWLKTNAPKLRLYAVATHTRIAELVRPDAELRENPLAPRERECLEWLANGLLSERIAENMGISHRTVEFHLRNARVKLGARSREHALAKALMNRLISV